MRKSTISDERIVGILAQEAAGTVIGTELCRKHGTNRQTLQRWNAKFGGAAVSELRRLKSPVEENRRLKLLVAEQALKVVVAKELQRHRSNGRRWRRWRKWG